MHELTLDEATLQGWEGRQTVVSDTISVATCEHMRSTLGSMQSDSLAEGTPLPPLWHWMYFHSPIPTDELGPDGHEQLGSFLPPVDLPRRMWAGGRINFYAPLIIGKQGTRKSTILSVTRKRGSSGELCFITVEHVITIEGQVCLTEQHDIVQREGGDTGVLNDEDDQIATHNIPLIQETATPDHWRITPSVALLFRYSAMTFNSHRIHYDRVYCKHSEGYPGLVFHGPLTATLMAHLAVESGIEKQLKSFEFKALRPLFDKEPFEIRLERDINAARLMALTPDGETAMQAIADFNVK
ncbi:MAG: MaoC family dehydratase N-terminal domain-containing protein [Granulosicoccus sp.]